jgi:hypothetical protein
VTDSPAHAPIRKRTLAWVTFEGTALFLTFGALAQVLDLGFGLWFTEAFVFFGVPWLALRRRGHRPFADAGLAAGGARELLGGFVVGVVNMLLCAAPITVVMNAAFERLAPGLVERFSLVGLFADRGPVETALVFAGAVVAAPIGEEFFFRGFLLRRARPRTERGWHVGAVVVVALLFSAMHLDPIGFVTRLELGVVLGLVFVRSGSLYASIGAHAGSNALACAAMLATNLADKAKPAALQPSTILTSATIAVLGAPAVFFVLRRVIAEGPPERDADAAPVAPWPWLRCAVIWVSGATLVLSAFVLLDLRGVELTIFDLGHPIAERRARCPARDELQALRDRARAGSAPISEYEARRVAYRGCPAEPR